MPTWNGAIFQGFCVCGCLGQPNSKSPSAGSIPLAQLRHTQLLEQGSWLTTLRAQRRAHHLSIHILAEEEFTSHILATNQTDWHPITSARGSEECILVLCEIDASCVIGIKSSQARRSKDLCESSRLHELSSHPTTSVLKISGATQNDQWCSIIPLHNLTHNPLWLTRVQPKVLLSL